MILSADFSSCNKITAAFQTMHHTLQMSLSFFFLFFCLAIFHLFNIYPHDLQLALISQGNVLSRLVGGPMFQKFRRENDAELGEVQK